MTAKQYLQSYKKLETRYKVALEELKNVEQDLVSIKSPQFDDKVQTSPKKDPIGDMVIQLENEKAKIAMKVTYYAAKMNLIKNQISELEECYNDYYVIILLRYVLAKDWKFICDKLCLSRSQANVVHGKALQEFDRNFNVFYSNK